MLFGVSNTSGATVTTTFGGKTYSATTDAMKIWRQKLPPQPASLVGVTELQDAPVSSSTRLSPCMVVLPPGWNWALRIAQAVLEEEVEKAGGEAAAAAASGRD